MNSVSDFANATRISIFCVTICVASMAFATGVTKGEGGGLQASPNGDLRERIVRAFCGPQAPKSFRMRQVWSGGARTTTTVLEVMKPDRSHSIQNDGEEHIFIGEKGYSRKRNGPWINFTDGMTSDTSISGPPSDITEQIKRIGQVKFIGADTLDGASVLAYEYELIEASGKRPGGLHKIWIGLNDGLPYRTESETQIRAEDLSSKPGDRGLITIKVVTTFYDYNAEINIDLPEKAAREAAESWLKLIDSGKYSDSWAEAASVLRDLYSEKSWEKRLNEYAEQASGLSPNKSRELISIESVKSLPSHHEREGVLLGYRCQLETLSPRSQTLELILDSDQVWRVANYTEVVPSRMDGSTPRHRFNMGGGGVGPRPALGVGDGSAVSVDTKPIPLNSPQPRYTEEARNNKIEGNVTMRVRVGADGQVKQVRIVRGLPDGLDEQAIQAAYQLKFKPAMKDGKPVAYWMPVLVEFNLGRK